MAKRKRRVFRFPDEFRRAAIQRVEAGERARTVAGDLDIDRTLIYRWMKKARAGEQTEPVRRGASCAGDVLQENQRLKQALAEKCLEVDFFRGALQKLDARRQSAEKTGEKSSTSRLRRG